MKTQTITFAHFKGGTGKTTSCLSIAGFLADHGSKVLLIDLDPQANATSCLSKKINRARENMFHVMKGRAELKDIITTTKISNLHLAPANEILVHATQNKYKSKSLALTLKRSIDKIKRNYDFVLIDLPPSNGHFIVNGVIAADNVILVLDSSNFSLEGVEKFNKVFNSYCRGFHFKPNISLALVTQHRSSLNPFKKTHSKFIAKETKKLLGKDVFLIPYSEHVQKSHSLGLPISHHSPGSKVGKAYMRVAEKIIKLK